MARIKYSELSDTDKFAYKWLATSKYFKTYKHWEKELNLVTENECTMLVQLILVEVRRRAFLIDITYIREIKGKPFVDVNVRFSSGSISYGFYTGEKWEHGLFKDNSHVLP